MRRNRFAPTVVWKTCGVCGGSYEGRYCPKCFRDLDKIVIQAMLARGDQRDVETIAGEAGKLAGAVLDIEMRMADGS